MDQLSIVMVLTKCLIRLGFQPSQIFSLEVLEPTKETALRSRLSLVWPGLFFSSGCCLCSQVVRVLRGSSSSGFCPTTFATENKGHTQNYSRSVSVFTDSISPPLHPPAPSPPRLARESPSIPVLLLISAKIPKQIAALGTCPLFHRIL